MNKRKQIIVGIVLNMDYSILQENCPTTFNDRRVLRGRMAERMKQYNPRRDWPETKKAKVYADSCYICFGVRFGTVKQYINTGE